MLSPQNYENLLKAVQQHRNTNHIQQIGFDQKDKVAVVLVKNEKEFIVWAYCVESKGLSNGCYINLNRYDAQSLAQSDFNNRFNIMNGLVQ